MTTFKQFLESFIELPNGGRVQIRPPTKYNPVGYLDFDNIARHSPQLKEILTNLIKQHPEVATYQLKFDGPGFSTVREYLQKISHSQFNHMPDKWYHGTSEWAWLSSISKIGLKPRSETQASAAYGANITSAMPGDSRLIYLMDNDGNAVRFAAREANGVATRNGHQSRPVVLVINGGINPAYLEADVDSRTKDWQKSLWSMGSVGYRRNIPSNFIKLHMVWDKEWVIV